MTQKTLTKRIIAAFASPAIPLAGLGLPLVVYLPPFYAEEMGLGLSLVGTIFMITRFWDVFTDPVLGILSDKFTTPIGRRRPWIILSVPILMFCVYKVFIPQPPVTGFYLFIWMILLYIGWTLLSISHMSWGAELSSNYFERSRIQGWREFALLFGMLAVLLLPTIIEQTAPNNGAMKVEVMGWFVSYVMDLPQWASLMLLVYFVANFFSIPPWIRISYKFEKHHTFAIEKVYASIILALMLLIPPNNLWLYGLGNTLFGLATGAGGFLLRSILADVTDHDNLKSGTQRTGLYYSLLTMTNKIGYALAVGITYPMLDWIGFMPGGNNSLETIESLKYMFILIPIPIMLLAALIMWNFPLDRKEQEKLRCLLEERDAKVNQVI